jgi:hypothetical protein
MQQCARKLIHVVANNPANGYYSIGIWPFANHRKGNPMNRIIYIVGLIVIVLFILGYFGLR